jgi:DNA helicase TIP49 (TBP-interacting protein)
MVGRQNEISDLVEVIRKGKTGFVLIQGSDGCGKTRIVLELSSKLGECRFLSAEEIDERLVPEIKETRIIIIDDAHRITGLLLLPLLLRDQAPVEIQ